MVDLASNEDQREYWRAVAYRVADQRMLFDEHEVSELLTIPAITVIPGTKRWVAGVANIRGELLPIIDFGDFLFSEPVKVTKQSRVLVITHDEIRSGLIVDEVYGMRRFAVDTRKPVSQQELDDVLKPLISGCYEEEYRFHIMDVKKLIDESDFMQAAA